MNITHLFHGSPHYIKDTIKPTIDSDITNTHKVKQHTVSATPYINIALVYSLILKDTSPLAKIYIRYSPNKIDVFMVNCFWTEQPSYIYKVSSKGFLNKNNYEFISTNEVSIKETIVVSPDQVKNLLIQGKISFHQITHPQ